VTVDVDKMTPGQIERGYMLDDAGMIIDVCQVVHRGNSFLLLTSLGRGEGIAQWLQQWRQLVWPDLKVFVTDVSAAWATLSLAGPKAEEVLAAIGISGDRPAPMTCSETTLLDHPCRILAADALDVPNIDIQMRTGTAALFWTRLLASGAEPGLMPVGLTARNMAEVNNGGLPLHTAYGGRWSPVDLGPVDALKTKDGDFVGRRMALRIAESGTVRPQLVSLMPEDQDLVVPAGALITRDIAGHRPARPSGYVMAGHISQKYDRGIALGFLDEGRKFLGETVTLVFDGKAYPAHVMTERAETEAVGDD